MLELHVQKEDKIVNQGAVQIRWTVDPETLVSLEGKTGEAFVLLVVGPEKEGFSPATQTRKLVPLKDGRAFVTFRRPGPNYVWAQIAVGNPKKLRDELLSRGSSGYRNSIIAESTMMPCPAWCLDFVDGQSDRMAIAVPEACFAKPPGPLMSAWLNWLNLGRGDNQCALRRRLLLAFTWQIPLFLVVYAIRLLAAVIMLMLGMRGVKYGELLFHPLRSSMTDCALDDPGPSLFAPSVVSAGAWPFTLAFAPLAGLIGFSFAARISGVSEEINLSILEMILYGYAGAIACGAIITILLVATCGSYCLFEWCRSRMAKAKPLAFDNETIAALSQAGGKKTLGNPSLRRRIILKYDSAKAWVCKPFAS